MTGDLTRKFEVIELDGGRTRMHLWLLLGPRGVVQFKAWPGSESFAEHARTAADLYPWVGDTPWIPADLGYHSPRPTYDGQEPIDQSCEYLDGMPCFYDGTSLGARELLERWTNSGCDDEVIWRVIADRYTDWLCSDEDVAASPVTQLMQLLGGAS